MMESQNFLASLRSAEILHVVNLDLKSLIKINEKMQNVLASPRSAYLKQEHLPCLLLDITNNSIRLKQRRDNLGMRPNETTS